MWGIVWTSQKAHLLLLDITVHINSMVLLLTKFRRPWFHISSISAQQILVIAAVVFGSIVHHWQCKPQFGLHRKHICRCPRNPGGLVWKELSKDCCLGGRFKPSYWRVGLSAVEQFTIKTEFQSSLHQLVMLSLLIAGQRSLLVVKEGIIPKWLARGQTTRSRLAEMFVKWSVFVQHDLPCSLLDATLRRRARSSMFANRTKSYFLSHSVFGLLYCWSDGLGLVTRESTRPGTFSRLLPAGSQNFSILILLV